MKVNLTSNIKHLRDRSGIYMFKFPNGKVYIGQSVDIYNRIKQHIYIAGKPEKFKNKVYRAINKYKAENVEVIIL